MTIAQWLETSAIERPTCEPDDLELVASFFPVARQPEIPHGQTPSTDRPAA
jgi:hypothetical protein